MAIDVVQHLQNRNYPASVQAKRIAWRLAQIVFRLSPAFLYGLRNLLLRLFGAQIGAGVRCHPSVRVMFPWNLRIDDHVIVGPAANLYALAPIVIETNVMVSQGAHLCAGSHDYRRPNFPTAHAPIHIAAGCWIAAEAFVGPGVTVGRGSVVGARAVVTKDVSPMVVVAGNPARIIKDLTKSP